MNRRVLLGIIPVAVFWVLTRVAPAWLAILGGFAASAVVFQLTRKSSRLLGWLILLGFCMVAATSAVGIIVDNEKAYLASGIATDFAMAAIHIGSLLIRRPLLHGIAREIFPAYTRGIRRDAPVVIAMSLAWAAFDTAHGVAKIYLLQHLSVGEFIIWSRVLLWPPNAILTSTTAALFFREARRTASNEPPLPDGTLPEPVV